MKTQEITSREEALQLIEDSLDFGLQNSKNFRSIFPWATEHIELRHSLKRFDTEAFYSLKPKYRMKKHHSSFTIDLEEIVELIGMLIDASTEELVDWLLKMPDERLELEGMINEPIGIATGRPKMDYIPRNYRFPRTPVSMLHVTLELCDGVIRIVTAFPVATAEESVLIEQSR